MTVQRFIARAHCLEKDCPWREQADVKPGKTEAAKVARAAERHLRGTGHSVSYGQERADAKRH